MNHITKIVNNQNLKYIFVKNVQNKSKCLFQQVSVLGLMIPVLCQITSSFLKLRAERKKCCRQSKVH